MAITPIIPVGGLFTDPNPNVLPAGALVRAENVVVRRPHVLEPRPGFGALTAVPATSSDRVRTLFAYDGKLYASVRASGGTWTLYSWNGAAWTTMTGVAATPPDPDRIEMKAVAARKNLYLTTATTIAKVVGASDSSVDAAGLSRAAQGVRNGAFLTSGATWLANGDWVAYRFVVLRKDANGVEVRSAPSGRLVIQNTSGSPAAVPLRIPLPPDIGFAAGDTLEVYRSEADAGDTPSDEMQLAVSQLLVSGDISTEYVDLDDRTSEESRGASLYTSPSQEGIAQENAPLPLAHELATFQGMLFAANLTRPASVVMALGRNEPTDPVSWGLKGVTGDFTNTSPNVINVSAADIAKLAVGMYVTDSVSVNFKVAGTNVPAHTKILSIGATSFVMDKNATATNAGVTFSATDVLTINSTEYICGNVESFASQPFQAQWFENRAGTQNLVHVINRTSATPDVMAVALSSGKDDVRLVLYADSLSGSVTVSATHGNAWSPALTTTPQTFATDRHLNGLAWSKQDEPEHMPTPNFALVGDALKRIIRLVATHDSLWIFKEDGVWRLTGSGPDDLRIDPHDAALLLLAPETVAVLRDRVYCWTNRGIVSLGDNGSIDVGKPIYESIRDVTQRWALYPSAAKGAFAVALATTDEYVLFLPETAVAADSTRAYVFNAATTCWTTWELAVTTATHNPADDLLYLGGGATTNNVQKERRNYGSEWDNYDASVSVTVSSLGTNVINLSGSVSYTEGDGIKTLANGQVAIITASGSGTAIPVDSVEGQQTGAGVLLRAFASTIEWAPQSAGNVALTKHWQEGAFIFEDMAGVYSMVHGFASELVATFQTFAQTVTRVITASPRTIRCAVPREASASVRLRPRIAITQAASRWALSGLSLLWEPIGDRVRR